jgi:hypothetical protein
LIAPAAAPTTDKDFFDALLDGELVPGLKDDDVLEALSASETAAALKNLNERETTPTPSRRYRKRDTTPILQLPTRLRVNVSPTKKAPPVIVKALNARKQRLDHDVAPRGSDSEAASSALCSRSESVPLQGPEPDIYVEAVREQGQLT